MRYNGVSSHGSASGLVSCADFKSVGSRGNPAPVGSIPTRFRQSLHTDAVRGGPMKKLAILVVILVGVWLGVNYVRTGQFSFLPTALSPEEQQVRDLERDLAGVNQELAQSGRAAGMTGMDTTSDVSALMQKKEKIEKQLEEARRKVSLSP